MIKKDRKTSPTYVFDMATETRLFGTSGIRGVPGEDLTPEFIAEISQSIGTFLKEGPILVGHDGRHSGHLIANNVAKALMNIGLDVGEAGLIPTPALQYCVRKMSYNGGIMVTASHNPSKYNGIKVSGRDGIDLTRNEEIIVEGIYYEKKFRHANIKVVGNRFQETEAISAYVKGILSKVDIEKIKSRRFRVVLDTGNGAQGVSAHHILEKLDCKLISLNAEVDGDFPGRGPEPTPDLLKDLSEAVKTHRAEIGVAFDGDGDRSLFCDEKGVVHYGDRSAALLADYIFSKNPGATIVTTVSASQAIDDIAKKHGLKIFKTKVGSVDVSNAMVEHNAIFGLEENGGCFYNPHIPVRDGAMTTALILEALANSEDSFSDMLDALPRYHQAKIKFECSKEQVQTIMKNLAVTAKGKIESIDGLKIWVDEKTWVLIRPSGTEPLIRVFAESDDSEKLSKLMSEYSKIIKAILNDSV
ncbi:MAG TPA: phosphoglucosamine mutase [Nitrososphaerales archaeon]